MTEQLETPPAAEDGQGQGDGQPDQAPPKQNRLSRRPQNPSGVYMMLAADASEQPPSYVEVGWYRAHSDEHAKRQLVKDVQAGHLEDLTEPLMDGKGLLLHPVPARSWPKVAPTGMAVTRTLVIG